MRDNNRDRLRRHAAQILGGCMILVILLIMNRDYPFVGHDYAYFIPRLLDTDLHTRINGLAIQWYTPSFGGGLPGFPNPQHLQYSLVQWMTFLIDPWAAVLVSTAVISLTGYYFFYKFLHEKLELDWRASTMGAMFFIGNGFYIEHLIAGQLGYQLFPLSAIILYALTDTTRKPIFNAALIAIVVTMMIYQAGFYLVVILILSLGMTVPLLVLYKPGLFERRTLVLTWLFSVILCTGMTASKIHATLTFLGHFPREVYDTYQVGLLQGISGVLAQLLGVMNLGHLLFLMGQNPEVITGVLIQFTGAEYGIWETDTGLSPVFFILLGVGLFNTVPAIFRNKIKLDRTQWISMALLALAAWVTLEFSLAKGILYASTKPLPILRSLHINVRFVSAYIIPLVIIGSFLSHNFFVRNRGLGYFSVGVVLTLLSLFSYSFLSAPIHQRFFDAGSSRITYRNIRDGEVSPITEIANIDVWQGFGEGKSSIKPYEPIFGYELEAFMPQIHLGSVLETEGDYFNMTNPASLVFPENNNTYPFERIKVSEWDKLQAFMQRRQPEWNTPRTQKILNIVSPAAFVFTLAAALVSVSLNPAKNQKIHS